MDQSWSHQNYVLAPRLIIGGTHFWNKADFYISFPLGSIPVNEGQVQDYSAGIVTGGRYLPLGLSSKWPRPFIGAQWLTPSFKAGDGPDWTQSKLGFELGLSLVIKKSYTIELGFSGFLNSSVTYPDSRETFTDVRLPSNTIGVAIKKYVDFTAGYRTDESKAYMAEARTRYAEKKVFNAISIGLGISANVQLNRSPMADDYPFFPATPPLSIYPDLALGYYLSKPDLAFRFSYRPIKTGQTAYGTSWETKEQRIGFEGFKFLFDYKGFVPFAGLGMGQTYTRATLVDQGETLLDDTTWDWSASLIFGWDIRPSDVEWFILRTNLRYIFDNNTAIDGQKISAAHLEINFIQFVFYPQRFKQKP